MTTSVTLPSPFGIGDRFDDREAGCRTGFRHAPVTGAAYAAPRAAAGPADAISPSAGSTRGGLMGRAGTDHRARWRCERGRPRAGHPFHWPAAVRGWRRCAEAGAAAVELALTLPLLVLALLGVVQVALVIHAGQVVTAAAQEGARVAASEDRSAAEGAAYATALLRAGLGRAAGGFSVGVAYDTPAGDVAVATVSGVYPTLAPVPAGGWPLRATARVRSERFRAGRW